MGRADEIQVNTYTTGNQWGSSLAMNAAGGFVVWESDGSSGTDSDGFSIQGQRYTSNGSPLGGQFQVNTSTTGDQDEPSVAMDAAGDFVVVWTDDSVHAQRFASDGSPMGQEFQVNTTPSIPPGAYDLAVAMDAAGDFVVVWDNNGSAGTDSISRSIQGQRYASDGSKAGGEFQVNTYTSSDQVYPSVSMNAAGDFVVVWNSNGSYGTDAANLSVQGQRYASDGSALGGEFQINTYTTAFQYNSSVAIEADGDFVVVWQSNGSYGTDSLSSSIQGQRYASDGTAVAGEFQINTYTTSYQRAPWVAMDAAGDFMVVWSSNGSDGTDSLNGSAQGQRYAADGSAVGDQFQVNTYTTSDQVGTKVALTAAGEFVVAWQSKGSDGTDTDGYSIQMWVESIFADGFESGDTSAWSTVVGGASP